MAKLGNLFITASICPSANSELPQSYLHYNIFHDQQYMDKRTHRTSDIAGAKYTYIQGIVHERVIYTYIHTYSTFAVAQVYISECSPNQTIWRRYPPLPRAHLHKCNQESEQCSSIYDEIYVASSIHYDKQLRVGR